VITPWESGLAIWLSRRGTEGPGGHPVLSASSKVVAYLVAVAIPASVALLVWRRDDLSGYERLGRSITLSGLMLMLATLAYCFTYHVIEGRLSDGGNPRP